MNLDTKLTEIFYFTDEFCKELYKNMVNFYHHIRQCKGLD